MNKTKIGSKSSQKQKAKPTLVYAFWAIAIATLVGLIVFVSINFGRFENLFAGSTFNTATAGNWATGTTWGGSAPGNWSSNTANINHNITLTSTTTAINGFTLITLNNGKSFTSGTSTTSNDLSFQNVTFNVTNGNIIVYGNLTLNNTALTITSGTLTVTGTLTLTGGATITSNSSGTISAGAITSSGSGGTLTVNSGALSVTNGLSINSGFAVNLASGVSASAASLSMSNNNDAILNNAGTLTINGNVSEGGVINNTGTMQINGNLVSSGSSTSIFTNTGNLNVTGSITLPSSGKLYENPGGKIVVDGSVTVDGNLNLVIGTNVSPPAYADLVIKQNLIGTGSGDVLFDKNSRVAIYGNVTDSGGGGTLFTVNNGGQVYVNGNMTYTGGGSKITNNNTTNPYGLYVNGTVSNSNATGTTSNLTNKATMKSTNLPFYNWVASLSNSPLPITLVDFKIAETTSDHITLSWSTTMEKNFDKFIIERSVNGQTFESIAELKGAGNSKTALNYSYQDNDPLIGTNYYRLKSVDLDKTFEYSKNVVSANFASHKEFSIYPNPSNGDLINFKINFEPKEDDVISVIDLSGAEVMRVKVDGSDNQIQFRETLKPGMYIVKYSSADFQRKERLQVK